MAAVDELKLWTNRMELAKSRWDDDVIKPNRVLLDYYRGRQWGTELFNLDKFGPPERIVENMVFSNVKVLLPRIAFRAPKVFVRPRRPNRDGDRYDYKKAASVMESTMNYYIRDLRMNKQMTRALLDALVLKFGMVRIGYTVESDWVVNDKIIEPNEFIKSEQPYVVRWSPKNFLIDPLAESFEEARWVAYRSCRLLDDVKKNPRFKANAKDLKPTAQVDPARLGTGLKEWSEDVKEHFETVDLWDIWDRSSKTQFIWVEGHDGFLFKEKWVFDLDGFPHEILCFNEVPDELIPMGDTESFWTQQTELNRLNQMELEHVKKSVPKYIVSQGISKTELDRLLDGEDSDVAQANEGEDPTKIVAPVPFVNMVFDHQRVKEDIRAQIREIFGVTRFDRGGRENVTTATEAQFIQNPSAERSQDRRSLFEEFWKGTLPKFAAVFRQFKDAAEFIPVLGADAEAMQPFLEWAPTEMPQDVEKEFLFDIEIGSTEPLNDAMRQQKMVALWDRLNGDASINQRELRRRLLEAFGEPDEKLLLTDEELASVQADQQGAAAQMDASQMMTDQMAQQMPTQPMGNA